MKVPTFDDLGKEYREVLSGKKSGVYQYNNKLTVNLKAAQGVSLITKLTRKGGSLETDVKGTWGKKGVTIDVHPMLPKAAIKYTHPVAHGLAVSVTDELPNPQKKGKVTVDYSQPHLTAKAACNLSASPVLEATVSTGYDGFVAAARALVDVPHASLSNWEVKAAYLGPNFVVGGHATQNLEKVTGSYWQLLDPMTSVAVEVQHRTSDNNISLLMGYSQADLEGHLTKVKMSSAGEVHGHRDMRVRADATVGVSVMVNALDFSQEPRIGFSMDHSP